MIHRIESIKIVPGTTFLLSFDWIYRYIACHGCGMPAGNAYPSGHLVLFRFLGLAYDPIVETSSPRLAVSFLDCSL